MRLDEGFQDQKLSLDITPLIDVVFLLVLFFALSTSFISPRALEQLKDDLTDLGAERERLTGEVSATQRRLAALRDEHARAIAEQRAEVERLSTELSEAEGEGAKLEWMVEQLEAQKASLERSVAATQSSNKSLKDQLEQAYEDYRLLDVELEGLKDEAQRQAAREKLLQALIDEKAVELAEREQALDQAGETATALRTELASVRTEAERRAERQRALEALLAERARDLERVTGQLEAARSRSESLSGELEQTRDRSRERASKLEDLRLTILRLEGELAKYRKVAELDREQVERILMAQEQLRAGLGEALEKEQVGIKRDQQRLTLQLSDQILFDSGSAEIKAGGLEVLRQVGSVLKDRIGGLQVQVAGHTDNVPVSGRSGPLGSNWGLSAARAVNVVKFFEEEVGLPAGRLSAIGYGEFQPIASNDTPQGRALNRRIEIVLVPR